MVETRDMRVQPLVKAASVSLALYGWGCGGLTAAREHVPRQR